MIRNAECKQEQYRSIRILAFSIFSLLFIYSIYSFKSPINSDVVSQNLYEMAVIVIILTIVCLFFAVYGFFRLISFSQEVNKNTISFCTYMGRILRQRKYANLMILSSVLYGIFFAFLSRILIYFPLESNSTIGFNIPSIALTICCGPPGYFPMATIRLTDNLSLLFIPLNLVLAVSLSILVGLNVALIIHTWKSVRLMKTRNISLISSSSAFAGLFIGCPTCAGTILLTILGLSASTSASLLAPFQSMFILMSLPVLVLTLLLILRIIRKRELCTLNR